MKRRKFLGLLGAGGLSAAGVVYWPDEGFLNPCLQGKTPARVLQHEVVQSAWRDINPQLLWDSHTHLIGVGHNNSGVWINPKMQQLLSPLHYVRYYFYMDASCVSSEHDIDSDYIKRLLRLMDDFPKGARLMLLAFDYCRDNKGQRVLSYSPFHVPNDYAATLAERYPDKFAWIASIHPYREDGVEVLEAAVARGAKAVKWLPPVMGIDPASAQCDRFYAAMQRLGIPLLTHTGDEHAFANVIAQHFGNPLRLRRALDHGVKVIMAHCAVDGENVDLDKGKQGPVASNFAFFTRMMEEPRYQGLLFADISALTRINHMDEALKVIVKRSEWHPRLINGSDYPLPGVMPVFSLTRYVELGYLSDEQGHVLHEVRQYNPLLFDFVLKRSIQINGQSLAPIVFESRRIFSQNTTQSDA